jgi:hypothetical protein
MNANRAGRAKHIRSMLPPKDFNELTVSLQRACNACMSKNFSEAFAIRNSAVALGSVRAHIDGPSNPGYEETTFRGWATTFADVELDPRFSRATNDQSSASLKGD